MFASLWNWLVSLFSSRPTPTPVPAPVTPPTPPDPIPIKPIPPVTPSTPTIQLGATGALVTQLQTKLISLGYLASPADGNFGPATQAAVESFQNTNGLTADGVVGQGTWNALNGSPNPAPPVTPTTPSARPSGAGNIRVCQGNITLSGLDVSDDEATIQWNLVSQSGRKFAFIKATEGITIQDSTFQTNWKVARAFLTCSPYHFYHAQDAGAAQAENFLKVIGKLNVGDMAPMVDVEDDSFDGQPVAVIIKNLQDTLDAIEAATGRVPIIYTGAGPWNELGNPVQFARYPLYVANIDETCPDIPPPWSNAVFWQWTWTEAISGVPVKCDADLFNGSAAQFQAFVRTGALPF